MAFVIKRLMSIREFKNDLDFYHDPFDTRGRYDAIVNGEDYIEPLPDDRELNDKYADYLSANLPYYLAHVASKEF